MSIRATVLQQSFSVPCGNTGSIFGEALKTRHVVGLWGQTLSLSPQTSGILDAAGSPDRLVPMDEDDNETTITSDSVSKRKPLESAIQTFSYTAAELASCAYVFFERQRQPVIVSSGVQGPRFNRDPVLPRAVYVDTVLWNPMLCNSGEEGHSFALSYEGHHSSSVEVTSSRVIIVYGTCSPSALEAGLVDPATRLCFGRDHPQELDRVLDDVLMDDDVVFLPLSEVMLGRALDKIPLRVTHNDHPLAADARKVWVETKSFLRSMQSSVVKGITNQNRLEFKRVGVSESELRDVSLDFLV